jgi:hypothetical protein
VQQAKTGGTIGRALRRELIVVTVVFSIFFTSLAVSVLSPSSSYNRNKSAPAPRTLRVISIANRR